VTLPPLLVFDLDGTLVPERGREVPLETAQALVRLRGLGVRVAVITGRDFLPPAIWEAVQPDAVATNNGGRIEIGGRVHASAEFTPAELEVVLAHDLLDARVVVSTGDAFYLDLPPDWAPEPWMRTHSFHPLAQAPREGVQKVWFSHPGVADLATRLRAAHPQLVLTGAQPPYGTSLSVTPAGAHKGAALERIAGALDIPLSRTVAFGDSDNDVAMLELAGHAVQVGTLPLLAGHADGQVARPEELGAYLHALAGQLENPQTEPHALHR